MIPLIDRLIKPSTRAFYREGRRMKGYSLFEFLHGYFYARWPYLYIGIGTGEHRLTKTLKPVFDWLGKNLFKPSRQDVEQAGQSGFTAQGIAFANTYHGKVMPLNSARQLISVKEEIRQPDLEQVIPYTRARAILTQHPEHIVVLDCPCRAARANPCLPLDVCLIIGEPFAGFVIEHHPQRARWITQAEAVEILDAEDRRGHVHHAFFKDAMLGRFYAICNCCQCCCGAMHAQRSGSPMLTSSGYLAQVDTERCIGCGNCTDYCQFNALQAADGLTVVDENLCMGCGVCVQHCDQAAIELRLAPNKGIPLEVETLL